MIMLIHIASTELSIVTDEIRYDHATKPPFVGKKQASHPKKKGLQAKFH